MPYKSIVADLQTITDRLNGAVIFGPFPNNGIPAGGLTISFTAPAATVTFSGSAGDMLTITEVVDQLRTQLNAAGVARVSKRSLHNQGNGITTDNAGGPANAMVSIVITATEVVIEPGGTADSLFGIAGTINANEVDPAKIYGFSQGTHPGYFVILIGE
jgi:hypothetical protein